MNRGHASVNISDIERALSEGGAGLRDDSRKVLPGDIFVAVKGNSFDGHERIDEAFERGAIAVVCERGGFPESHPRRADILSVEDSRKALGSLARKFFRDPSGELIVFGVTGTNGKSTTVSIIESVFNAMGIPCGMTGTVFNRVKGDALERSDMTTQGVLRLNGMLREMVDDGKKAAAVEVSSHALDQDRVFGIGFDGAVFTNLTPEHLDYHGDMDAYLKAKAKIAGHLKPGGVLAVNNDDPKIRRFFAGLNGIDRVTFGFESSSDLTCSAVSSTPDGTELDLIYGGKNVGRVKSSLAGKHNISNIMGAAALFLRKGFSSRDLITGIDKAIGVPGRLERIVSPAPFSIFVDYAHTPDALRSALESVKAVTTGKLYCVFGCGGNRDRTKRPVMGRIAADISDAVILTDDNPRKEDPESILREIEKGIPEGREYRIIRDRMEAIVSAVKRAKPGDTVIIAGKGHENYQIFHDRTVHFDDRESALSALAGIGYGS